MILEKSSIESERLVREDISISISLTSTTRHEKPGGNMGGPPPKAKYYLVTDREQYREGKVKRTPKGE